MANETHWELTFLDVDNIEKTETYNNETEYYNRVNNLWQELRLIILSQTSGSNA